MSLDLATLKSYCHVDGTDEDGTLQRLLDAASKHVEADLGFSLDDETEFPDGAPEDVEQAVLMTAAHWFANREAVLVELSSAVLPIAAQEIVANHRAYSFEPPED